MANLYVTGPVHIYVSLPPGINHSGSGVADPTAYPTTLYYLGTGQQPPVLDIIPVYSPVANDIGGDQIPIDDQYMGKVGGATVTLSRWNEYVLNLLDNIPASIPTDSARGADGAQDTGTLMQFEGATFHAWYHFPYYSKVYGTLYNMPAGYHALACVQRPWQISPGTQAKRRLFSVEWKRVYKPSDGTFKLFDHTMTTVPSTPPTVVTGLVS